MTTTSTSDSSKRPSFWADAVVFIAFVAMLFAAVKVIRGMEVPFSPAQPPQVGLEVYHLPYYALRTCARMILALLASFIFSIAIGYAAAKNRAVGKVVVPALDILQSVPVLSFLAMAGPLFMPLFPGNLIGLELTSIFTVFTSQVWNMTYAFYHAIITLPPDLDEAARVHRLNRWQRLLKVELPYTMVPLMWNTMMSISGGWFFVVASEVISLSSKTDSKVFLPGLGSYVGIAIDQGDVFHTVVGVSMFLLTISLMTIFFTRPLVVWSQKFKYEYESSEHESYFVLAMLERSRLVQVYSRWFGQRLGKWFTRLIASREQRKATRPPTHLLSPRLAGALKVLFIVIVVAICGLGAWAAVEEVQKDFSLQDVVAVIGLAFLTLGRVITVVILSSVIWVPLGVWIGQRPKVANFVQPIIDVLAGFPANCIYPLAVVFCTRYSVSLNWVSIALLTMGAQWYLLFNVIAGASLIPNDLRDASRTMRLGRVARWKTLILPVIFPCWVTGALTAAGGAWNATIVAEAASWKDVHLKADGLGAYIAQAYDDHRYAALILGTVVMTILVVIINRLLWQRLYDYAEKRCRLD